MPRGLAAQAMTRRGFRGAVSTQSLTALTCTETQCTLRRVLAEHRGSGVRCRDFAAGLELQERVVNQFTDRALSAEMKEITPALALDYIQYNYFNRPLKTAHANNLAQQMIDNNYIEGVGDISFAKSGRLINGQHTLHAIINSETSQTCCIRYGLPEDAFEVFDIGIKRSMADALKITIHEAAICNLLHSFIKHSAVRPSPKEIRHLHNLISAPLEFIKKIENWHHKLSPAAIPAAFCASWILNPNDLDYMFTNLRWLSNDTELNSVPPKIVMAFQAYAKSARSKSSCGTSPRISFFIKAMKVFEPSCCDVTRIYETEGAPLNAMKEKIREYFFGVNLND